MVESEFYLQAQRERDERYADRIRWPAEQSCTLLCPPEAMLNASVTPFLVVKVVLNLRARIPPALTVSLRRCVVAAGHPVATTLSVIAALSYRRVHPLRDSGLR